MHVSYAVCTRCAWLECTSLSFLLFAFALVSSRTSNGFHGNFPRQAKVRAHQIAGHTHTAEDYEQQLLNTKTRIDAVQTWISELEDSVAKATACTILEC